MAHLLSPSQHRVELLEQVVGGVGGAVHHGLILALREDAVLLLQELVEVLPVVGLAGKLETVVVLVHLDFLGVVAGEDLGVDPSIGQVTLRVRDLVRQIQRVDPLLDLSGQRQGCCLACGGGLHFFLS